MPRFPVKGAAWSMSFEAGSGAATGLGAEAVPAKGAIDILLAEAKGFEGPPALLGRPSTLLLPGKTVVMSNVSENMYAGEPSSDCCVKYEARRDRRSSMRKTHFRCGAFQNKPGDFPFALMAAMVGRFVRV